MIVPILASCDSHIGGGRSDGGAEESEDAPTTAYVREKYAGYDYDGYTFRVLSIDPGQHYYWMIDGMDGTGWCNEVWYEEDNADVQIHSVFTRNLLAEDLLGIRIALLRGGGLYEIDSLVKTLVKAGGDDFDMTLGSQCRYMPLASEGYFRNLLDIGTLDLSNGWWDKEYTDTFTYKNSYLYTVCGDYNIFDEYAAACIFYNKQVVENFNLADPADLVDAGTWTIDAMMDMASKVTYDLTGDGMDISDAYGFYDNPYALIHLTEGCNIRVAELDGEGVPQVVIESEEFLNAVQSVFEKVILNPAVFLDEGTHDKTMLKEDRTLFLYEQLGGINMLRDMESDFSLLPLPKLNEDQREYTSVVNGIWLTVLSVPVSAKETDRTGIIMDVLGGMSTDTVEKTLNEVILGPKLFREERTVDMLGHVIESKRYDWGKEIPWAYPISTILAEQTESRTFTLASSVQRIIKVVSAQLRRFAAGFEYGSIQ